MKASKKPLRTAVHLDGNGNKLIIDHFPAHALIKLKLASENRQRVIGTLDIVNRALYITREKSKHLFRKLNAYGMNHYILKEAKLFDTIILNDETATWDIPREFILNNGKFLNFSNHGGFELQIFINLSDIETFKK
jgi:hypothetical protein